MADRIDPYNTGAIRDTENAKAYGKPSWSIGSSMDESTKKAYFPDAVEPEQKDEEGSDAVSKKSQ